MYLIAVLLVAFFKRADVGGVGYLVCLASPLVEAVISFVADAVLKLAVVARLMAVNGVGFVEAGVVDGANAVVC